MKKKSKILCTLILCFSIVFCSSFVSFAVNSGLLYEDFNIETSYIENYPYYTGSRLQSYAQANNLPSDFDFFNSFPGLFDSGSSYVTRNNLIDDIYNFDTFISSVNNLDVSNLPIIVLSPSGSYPWVCWVRVSGSGKIALVGNYIVSDEAFTIYYTNSANNQFAPSTSEFNRYHSIAIDTSNTNGLYVKQISTQLITNTALYCVFTDLPIYLPTISGSSGYSASNSLDISDFTFLADNINYNYLLLDGIVDDPQAPDIPSDPWWDDAKHFLNFKVSSIYGWDTSGTDTVTHNMLFNWNSDMVMNPDYYVLNLVYRIDYKDSFMANEKSYYYTSSDFTYRKNLEYLAYNTNSGRLVNKYAMELPFSSFYDENNNSFSNDLKASITRMTGTYSPSISSIIDTSNYELDMFWGIVTKQNIANNKKLRGLKNLNVPDVPTNVEVFKITCVLSVGRVANPSPGDVPLGGNVDTDYMSGYNVSQFNFLSGNSSVLQDDNVQNLYPSEDENLPSVIEPDEVIPSGNNYSGSTNAYGGNATVNINTDPMNMWSPEVIKSIKDTFDFIQSQLSEYKDNNFLGFMIESYKIIPDPFWDMVILAGGVITGFAVIRFIRNK